MNFVPLSDEGNRRMMADDLGSKEKTFGHLIFDVGVSKSNGS